MGGDERGEMKGEGRGVEGSGGDREGGDADLAEETAEEQEEVADRGQRGVVSREGLREEALGVAQVGVGGVGLAGGGVGVAVGYPHGHRAVGGAALQRGAHRLVEVLRDAGAEAVLAVELDLEEVALGRVVLEQAHGVVEDAAPRHPRQVRRDGPDAHAVHAPLRFVHLRGIHLFGAASPCCTLQKQESSNPTKFD